MQQFTIIFSGAAKMLNNVVTGEAMKSFLFIIAFVFAPYSFACSFAQITEEFQIRTGLYSWLSGFLYFLLLNFQYYLKVLCFRLVLKQCQI